MITIKLGSTFDDMAQGVAALKEKGIECDVEWAGGYWIATVR